MELECKDEIFIFPNNDSSLNLSNPKKKGNRKK